MYYLWIKERWHFTLLGEIWHFPRKKESRATLAVIVILHSEKKILIKQHWVLTEGKLTIFYGWRSRRRAGNRSDKKRKLANQLLFYFILRHAMKLCTNHTFFRWKTCQKHKKNQWNLWNSPSIFFFPPTWTCRHILFFIFFSPTSLLKNPCRDPSIVEYSECALTEEQCAKFSNEL